MVERQASAPIPLDPGRNAETTQRTNPHIALAGGVQRGGEAVGSRNAESQGGRGELKGLGKIIFRALRPRIKRQKKKDELRRIKKLSRKHKQITLGRKETKKGGGDLRGLRVYGGFCLNY